MKKQLEAQLSVNGEESKSVTFFFLLGLAAKSLFSEVMEGKNRPVKKQFVTTQCD